MKYLACAGLAIASNIPIFLKFHPDALDEALYCGGNVFWGTGSAVLATLVDRNINQQFIQNKPVDYSLVALETHITGTLMLGLTIRDYVVAKSYFCGEIPFIPVSAVVQAIGFKAILDNWDAEDISHEINQPQIDII